MQYLIESDSRNMTAIEICCLLYPGDLKITVPTPEELTDETLSEIKFKAQEICYVCNKRTFGDDCLEGCPIPKVGLANLKEIKEVLEKMIEEVKGEKTTSESSPHISRITV